MRKTAALIAATFGICLITSNPVHSEETCADVAAWVETHADDLPDTLQEFEPLPMRYRRAAFGALTVDQKAGLLRSHADYVLSVERLDETQRQIVRDVFAWATAKRIADRAQVPDVLMKRVNDHFSWSERVRIFATVGPPETVRFEPAGQYPSGPCECSNYSNYCGYTSSGQVSSCIHSDYCLMAQWGCGFLWMYECRGYCL